MKITLKDFKDAQERIKSTVRHTPLDISNTLSKISEIDSEKAQQIF